MFQVIVVHGRIFFIKLDLMDEFAVMLYIMTGFPSVISKWGVCRADKHSLYKPASNQKWEAFYFYFFHWICWNQNQGCVSVCVCVWALQPRRLCRFWWNFAQMVRQIFANCGLRWQGANSHKHSEIRRLLPPFIIWLARVARDNGPAVFCLLSEY